MTPDAPPRRLPPLWATAVLAVVALALDLAVDVAIGSTLQRQERLIAALERDPAAFTSAEIASVEGRIDTFAVASPVLFGLSVLAVGVFLRAAWLTARALEVHDLRHGPRWAVIGWFVPVAGFFVPKQIVDDLWRATDDRSPQPYWSMRPRPALVTVWWVVFLVTAFGQRLASTGSPPALFVLLVLDVATALLTTAVVVGLALRVSRRASTRRTPLALPAVLRGPRVLAPAWLPTGLAVAAAAVLVLSLGVSVREGSRLPEPLRAQEAAALALPASPGVGPSLPARPDQLAVVPSARPTTLDPSGPFEATLLEPPGFTRVTDDPVYAGAYDLERLLAGVPEADREAARSSLESFGFVQAQQAAFESAQQALEVVVFEFGDASAARAWVAASADVAEGAFPVDTPGGTGHRETLDDATVVDTVELAVGARVYQLDLIQPARFPPAEAVRLLQLQHDTATQPTT